MRWGKTDNFNVQCGDVSPIFRLAEESNYMWRGSREEEVVSDLERIREENSRLYERVGALTRECDGLKKMALERHEEVGDRLDPMKSMLLQIFLGNLISDLRAGKVKETIEALDQCSKKLLE